MAYQLHDICIGSDVGPNITLPYEGNPLILDIDYKQHASNLFSKYDQEMNPNTIKEIQKMRDEWLDMVEGTINHPPHELFSDDYHSFYCAWDRHSLRNALKLVECCNCLLEFVLIHPTLRWKKAVVDNAKRNFCKITSKYHTQNWNNQRINSAFIDTRLIYQAELHAVSDVGALLRDVVEN